MNRNVKAVAILLVIAVVVVTTGYFLWHMYLRRPVTVSCADGSHSTIEHVRFHEEILDLLREVGSHCRRQVRAFHEARS